MSDQLGPFVLDEELGQGAMGTVYRCRKEGIGRDLAIKVLSPEVSHDKEFLRRFEREGQIASSLKHPNIVPVLEAGKCENQYYILMELVTGSDLQNSLRELNGVMEWPKAAESAAQILEALAHAHEKGVVHRDVKPANVLITGDGNLLLTDFSVAQSHEGTKLTTAGTLLGTPEYMAPEQFSDAPIDGRTDIYAASLILYEMLTNHHPYRAKSIPEVIKNQLFGSAEDPGMLNAHVPRPLSRVVLKGLSKKAEDRYDNAEAMAKELRQIVVDIEPSKRDLMTVLMVDVDRSSLEKDETTATSERLKGLRERLNSQFRRAGVFVFHWFSQGAVVLFDDVQRAFNCGRKIQEEVSQPDDPKLVLAVVTGEVYPDPKYTIRRPDLGEFACQTVDVGCRMLELCQPGSMWVCSRSYGALRGLEKFEATGKNIEGENMFALPAAKEELAASAAPEPPPPPKEEPPPPPPPADAPSGPIELSFMNEAGEPQAARGETEARRKRVRLPMPPSYEVAEQPQVRQKGNPLPTILAYLTIFALILGGAYFVVFKKGDVAIDCAPSDVTISVDRGEKQEYSKGQILKLKTGPHTIDISAKGYATLTRKVTVKEEGTTKVDGHLKPAK